MTPRKEAFTRIKPPLKRKYLWISQLSFFVLLLKRLSVYRSLSVLFATFYLLLCCLSFYNTPSSQLYSYETTCWKLILKKKESHLNFNFYVYISTVRLIHGLYNSLRLLSFEQEMRKERKNEIEIEKMPRWEKMWSLVQRGLCKPLVRVFYIAINKHLIWFQLSVICAEIASQLSLGHRIPLHLQQDYIHLPFIATHLHIWNSPLFPLVHFIWRLGNSRCSPVRS